MSKLSVTQGRLSGVRVIEPELHGDARGYFCETFQLEKYQRNITGIQKPFVQDNVSKSRYGTLRGMHYQLKRPQAKLIGVLGGCIRDVVLDLRRSSPTFGQWESYDLSEENHRQLYIPEGFAHGFCVLSECVYFYYKCSDFYAPDDEYGVRWNDPALAIEWGIENPALSERDRALPLLSEMDENHLPD